MIMLMFIILLFGGPAHACRFRARPGLRVWKVVSIMFDMFVIFVFFWGGGAQRLEKWAHTQGDLNFQKGKFEVNIGSGSTI